MIFLVKLMKQNIKIFLVALLIGGVSTYFFAYKYNNTITGFALSPKVTIFYVGSYNNLNEAEAQRSKYNSAIIYSKNNIYKVVVGVYSSSDSIDLMRSYFASLDIVVYEESIKVDNAFLKKIEPYDLLIKTSSKDYYSNLNNSLLNLFNEYIS